MCFLPSVLFLTVSWSKSGLQYPASPQNNPAFPEWARWDISHQERDMQICVFQLERSKNYRSYQETAANRPQNVSDWMGDVCATPSTENYSHLGVSCPLTVSGKIPTGSQWARISTVVLYQEKHIQRDKHYIS